ncbi:hypothetical protein PACTADRAFT_49247 [Pachysolen tannophilus NRRL Y-2460]|uniref:SUN domain-containing protein n=1 Tax=Pachysolen tannophilus NRRL Y-2460 TaxID=669874 RepID=A0A1E4TVP6_PACTA|nr:hypothetical protein PACTADRAFT_49247 [Pachysolen tannophilus NRRL Y-2460]
MVEAATHRRLNSGSKTAPYTRPGTTRTKAVRLPLASQAEVSSDDSVKDLQREQQELRRLALQFEWPEEDGLIEDEEDLQYLNNEYQLKNQELFSKNYIKNLKLNNSNDIGIKLNKNKSHDVNEEDLSQDRDDEDGSGSKEEDDDDEEEDDDNEEDDEGEEKEDVDIEDDGGKEEGKEEVDTDDDDYIYHKEVENSLDSDDENLEEEYESEFDDEDEEKFATGRKLDRDGTIDYLKSKVFSLQSQINPSKIVIGIIITVIFSLIIKTSILNFNNYSQRSILNPIANAKAKAQYIPVESLVDINFKFKNLQDQLADISLEQNSIINNNAHLTEVLSVLQKNLNNKWEQINNNFHGIRSSIVANSKLMDQKGLATDFKSIVEKLNILEAKMKNNEKIDINKDKFLNEVLYQIKEFEASLEKTESKVEELFQFKNQVDKAFDELSGEMISKITSRLPYSIPAIKSKNGEMQLIPEFQNFLKNIINDSVNAKLSSVDLADAQGNRFEMTWDDFLAKNGYQLHEYLENFVTKDVQMVKKSDFEKILVDNFKASKDKMDKELNKLRNSIDEEFVLLDRKVSRAKGVSHSRESDLSLSTSELFVENLIDKKFDEFKNNLSNRKNYADPYQGAVILNQLTSKPLNKKFRRRTSVISRVAFGWLDFLKRNLSKNGNSSNSLYDSVIGKLHYENQYNCLLDNGLYWTNVANDMHIGIRLSKPIIITEILFEYPRSDNPMLMSAAPKKTSIYIKPSPSNLFKDLKKLFEPTFNQDFINRKISESYVKVLEFEYNINDNHVYQFVKFPKKLYEDLENLKISEIYIDVESNWGNSNITNLYNIKVFGVNEDDINYSKIFLGLDKDATQSDVMKAFKEKIVDGATYKLDKEATTETIEDEVVELGDD